MPAEHRDDLPRADPDSRARTHLANERTFLAWLRTGLTTIALGLAAGQLLTAELAAGVLLVRALAVTLVTTGIALTLTGARRFLHGERQIEAGGYWPGRAAILASCAAIVGIGALALLFLLLLRR